ncbi:MAG TPA: hypothetical protein VIC06_01020 [Solirubrobacteraceae bacterium]
MSFFDDDEDEPTGPSPATPRTRVGATPRPSPRRPQSGGAGAGGGSLDHHALLVRRRIAAGVGVVLLIVIVLIVNGCLKGRKQSALKDYNHSATQLVAESDRAVGRPLFAALAGASGSTPLQVSVQIDGLRQQASAQAQRAKGLSVPGEMTGAQRNLLLLLDLRTEGVGKVAEHVRTALGGQSKQASTLIAGDMENFLASDVLYSQRVAPLIAQTLGGNGIHEPTASTSNFLPNIGWLEPATVLTRLTGKSSSSTPNGAVAPGTHGHSVTGVTVGASTLQPAPAVNHVHSGANPTFTVMVENGGSNPETNVKVEVAVTSGGKELKSSHVINKTEPGKTSPVDIPVEGVALNAASRVAVNVQPVPGETNTENNKQTYDVVFE